MATLTIRNLPDELHAKLRVRAAQNGRSMEAEVREMISQFVQNGGALPDSKEVLRRVEAARALVARRIHPDDRLIDTFMAERQGLWSQN
jgi:plasmid stability protein